MASSNSEDGNDLKTSRFEAVLVEEDAVVPLSGSDNEQLEAPIRRERRSVSAEETYTLDGEGRSEIQVLNQRSRRHCSTTNPPSFSQTNKPNSEQCFRKPNTFSDFPNPMKVSTNNAQLETRDGNMILQVVLPTNGDTITTNNESLLYDNFKKRALRTASSRSSLQDINSIASPSGFSPISSRSFTFLNNKEVGLQGPSTEDDKNKMFRECLTKILSSVYALFIVTLGLVIYVTDVVFDYTPLAEAYSLYLVAIAFGFLLYLMVDVRLYTTRQRRMKKSLEQNRCPGNVEFYEHPGGDLHVSIPIPKSINLSAPPAHNYCFNNGRHSGNFYLKIGAAGFCLGHLVHSGLLLGYQIVFLTSDESFYDCANFVTLVLDVLYPVYSFFLLFFIFKYSNLIINRHISLMRFGLMHSVASSLCFWMWTIIRETMDSLSSYDSTNDSDKEENKKLLSNSGSLRSARSVDSFDDNHINHNPMALELNSYSRKGAEVVVNYFNNSQRLFDVTCKGDQGLKLIYQNYSPYLYPFTVEYSILVVGVLFLIWQSIGKCKDNAKECYSNNCSNVVLYADFHSANKGLFCGIMFIVLSIVSIILFLIAINDEKYKQLGILVNTLTEIIFLLSMAVACTCAYRQIITLDVNKHSGSLLDDLLLFVCIPAFFLDTIFGFLPAVKLRNGFTIAFIIVQLIQVLIQTTFIIDGLRRCSNSKKLREKKPGRELVTFLIVCNVAMWITQTFEIKSHGLKDGRYEFYGMMLWTIIGHMTMPLMMFYRFHSSVCLVDIWKLAYEPA